MVLSLGGVRVAIRCWPAGPPVEAHEGLAPYACPPPADWALDLEVATGPFGGPTGVPVVVSSGETGRRRYRVSRYDLEGSLDEASRLGTFRHEGTRHSVLVPLKIALSLALPGAGGMLIHAAAALVGGRGYLFPGESGAGKSTLLRAGGGDVPLSDETAIVRRSASGFDLYGTPFHGELTLPPRSDHAPLAAIAFPDRALPSGAHPLAPPEALARLMRCVVNFCLDDPELDRELFALAAEVSASVPAFAVSLEQGEAVWGPLGAALPA